MRRDLYWLIREINEARRAQDPALVYLLVLPFLLHYGRRGRAADASAQRIARHLAGDLPWSAAA